MSIIKKIFGKKEDIPSWEHAQTNNLVYPTESISLVSIKTKKGIGTGWIDKAYLKYPYKKNCRFNALIEIDLSDEIAQNNPDLGMSSIEDFLIDELRKVTIAHAIVRLVTETGMEMEFYTENEEQTKKFLKTASNDPNRLFSFSYKISDDQWWLAVRPLLRMK